MDTGRRWQMMACAGLTLASVWVGQARGDFFFGTPKNLGPLVNSSDSEYDPTISADGLELYFQSGRPGGQGDADLYVTKRASVHDEWQAAQNLGPAVNTAAAEFGPSLSADGLTLYFNSNRPGGFGGHDLYLTTRASRQAPWGKPVNLGPVVNGSYSEVNPCISRDGLSLYFADVEGGPDAPHPDGLGNADIWVTTRASLSDPWGPPVNLGAPVNTADSEGGPEISDDGLHLFLNRNRYDAAFFDLWVASRRTPQDPWSAPVNLGAPVNTNAWEGNAELAADGRTLYFVSSRGSSNGTTDLWEASVTPVVDLNGDGRVDQADVSILMSHWGQNCPRCDIGPTPFGDGIVDMKDLAVLTQYAAEEVADPTLVMCWKLDEANGAVAGDCVASADGKLVGGPKWRPDAGAVGGALELDGVDDYVSAVTHYDPSQGPFSVFAWVKGGKPGQVILSRAGGANWLMADAALGALTTDLRAPTRSDTALFSQTVITDGNWHRVGFVWDGARRTLYADGAAVAEDAQKCLKSTYGNLCLGTGKDLAPGTFWSGLIDDVRLYTRAVKP